MSEYLTIFQNQSIFEYVIIYLAAWTEMLLKWEDFSADRCLVGLSSCPRKQTGNTSTPSDS